jgi:hypothetical protein
MEEPPKHTTDEEAGGEDTITVHSRTITSRDLKYIIPAGFFVAILVFFIVAGAISSQNGKVRLHTDLSL